MPLEGQVVQLITTLGAAGALVWVLKLIVDGKLHSHSEVEGLRSDKDALLEVNEVQGKALAAANDQLETILDIYKQQARGGV